MSCQESTGNGGSASERRPARVDPPRGAGYLSSGPSSRSNRMHVEWTTYGSPVGALTLVECEAGPLVVEFPHRATSVKWAVRLRSAIPELHIAQGPCRATAAWLDEYFAGSARPIAFPDHLKQWFD